MINPEFKRDTLEVDVLFVGAGPASLAGAWRLARLARQKNLPDLNIAVIEKGKAVGPHGLSGAVVDPRGFDELLAGEDLKPPYDAPVVEDRLYFLTATSSFRVPVVPAAMHNKGLYIASLGRLVAWMAEQCESRGVDIFPEFPAVDLLWEGERVVGVRTGDKGVDKNGKPKANFEPGVDLRARVTVLGEGPRGTLTGRLISRLGLDASSNPQIYAVGVKELWRVPKGQVPAGRVWHTMGHPLGGRAFGGGFIYCMSDELVDLGFVVGLDYEDPLLDPHEEFQKFKQHPLVAPLLRGGSVLCYGAKAIPEGGYYSVPRLYGDGVLIAGDSGGLLNAMRLKGIHLAVKSGMLAAETILEALQQKDTSARVLAGYQKRYEQSWAGRELYRSRNFRQAYQSGFWRGVVHTGLQMVTRGRGVRSRYPTRPGHTMLRKLEEFYGSASVERRSMAFDGKLTFDRLTDVYYSGTAHEEDQPCHLIITEPDICHTRCTREFGNPCQYFCPAAVYEMAGEGDQARLHINFSNCVHCKTCDIMDPYQVILWTPPEGGDGPDYKNM